jgi:hypothetical protein
VPAIVPAVPVPVVVNPTCSGVNRRSPEGTPPVPTDYAPDNQADRPGDHQRLSGADEWVLPVVICLSLGHESGLCWAMERRRVAPHSGTKRRTDAGREPRTPRLSLGHFACITVAGKPVCKGTRMSDHQEQLHEELEQIRVALDQMSFEACQLARRRDRASASRAPERRCPIATFRLSSKSRPGR